jgi:hypothetical protein
MQGKNGETRQMEGGGEAKQKILEMTANTNRCGRGGIQAKGHVLCLYLRRKKENFINCVKIEDPGSGSRRQI